MGNFTMGQVAYGIFPYTGVEKVTVNEIFSELQGIEYAKVSHICSIDKNGKEICSTHGESGIKLDNLFTTSEEAYAAMEKHSEERVNDYLSQIKSLADLIVFPLTHCFCGEEYTDYEAIKAYKIKAKEFGFDTNKAINSY